MADKVVVEFDRERETKNKQRFSEIKTDAIGKLYVGKKEDERLGKPKKIRVTIEAV